MAKTTLFHAVCTVALLAAVPALAQRPEAGMTNSAGTPNPMAAQPAKPAAGSTAPANGGANSTSMAPAGSSAQATPSEGPGKPAEARPSHHASKGESMRKGDTSQDAAVDGLNDRSYAAAQQGQTFNADSAPRVR